MKNSSQRELNERGLQTFKAANYTKALEYFDKALSMDPYYVDAWNNKGLALGKLGRYDEAIKAFDEAIALDKEFATAYSNKGIPLYEWELGATVPDEKIGSRFHIKKLIGRGGMGEVWLVDNPSWGIEFAVKNPRPELIRGVNEPAKPEEQDGFLLKDDNSDTISKRFQTEFRDWIRIPIHPNIVTCFYALKLLGLPRIFLEYVEGTDLKEWMKRWIVEGRMKDWKKIALVIAI